MFDFHGDDVSFKEKEIINQKLNDKNNPPSLEDLLVLEGIASEFKSKNKKLIEFCTKEKLKQMLDYIIKEPKVDDYNKAHKFPFICSKIFDLDIYDIVKYFFMTKNELIEDKNKINLNLDLREYDSSEIELRNQYEEDFFGNVINEFNMDDNGNENENSYNNNKEEKKEEQKENNEDEINYKDNNDNMNNNNDNINEQKNDDKIENYNINENKKEDEDDLVNHIDEEVNQKNEKNEDNIENKKEKDKNEKIEENKENNNDKIQENQDNLINHETNNNKDEAKEDTKEEKLSQEKDDKKNTENNNTNNNNEEIKDEYPEDRIEILLNLIMFYVDIFHL